MKLRLYSSDYIISITNTETSVAIQSSRMAQAQIDCCKADGSSNPNNRESSKRVDEHDGMYSTYMHFCAFTLTLTSMFVELTDEFSLNLFTAAVSAVPECAVCLQLCIHPARLPCNHVFCYLCVKGVANQSKRCPMCRQEIPADFLERPQLVDLDQAQQKEAVETEESHEEYQWFYEGRNGNSYFYHEFGSKNFYEYIIVKRF